jgi:hypothetical protein
MATGQALGRTHRLSWPLSSSSASLQRAGSGAVLVTVLVIVVAQLLQVGGLEVREVRPWGGATSGTLVHLRAHLPV